MTQQSIESIPQNHIRAAPWSAQPTDCMDNEPELSLDVKCKGMPRNTDQFRLNPTQSCAPGRGCDQVSSVYHLTLWKCSGISRHATKPRWPCPACIPSTTSIPAPTIAMTNYTHALIMSNSSVFHM